MVSPVAVAVPDVASPVEQINIHCGTWDVTLNLENVFFSKDSGKDHQKHSAFSWQGQSYTFVVILQESINAPAQCHNLVCRHLDCFSLPRRVILVHYVDDIVLIRPSEQEVAATLDLQVRHLHTSGWDRNPTKIPEPSTSGECLRI